jgi:hypothetical protein
MQFSVLHLLNNEILKLGLYKDNTKNILIKIPTIIQMHTDLDLSTSLNLFTLDDTLLFEDNANKISRLDFLNYFLLQSDNKDQVFLKAKEFILNLEFINGAMTVDSIELTNEDLMNIMEVLKLGFGSINFAQYKNKKTLQTTDQNLSEDEKRMLDLEKKVQSKKSKEQQESKDDGEYSIENIIVTVIYEYRLTMQEVLNLNYFTLFWYFKYAMGIHSYRMQNFALPSGAIKDVKYFTEKINKK